MDLDCICSFNLTLPCHCDNGPYTYTACPFCYAVCPACEEREYRRYIDSLTEYTNDSEFSDLCF